MTTVELEALPRWDLSNVYPSLESDKFKQAVSDFNRQVDQLDVYLDENRVTAHALKTSGAPTSRQRL